MSRVRASGGAVLVAAAAVVALSIPAGASGRTSATAAKPAVNEAFAGYQVTKSKAHIHSASVRFILPSIRCRKNLSGVGPAVLIQSVGNAKTNAHSESGGGVGVACEHKTPVYNAIVEVVNHSYDDNLHPLSAGDKVVITVTYGQAATTVSVRDVTAHHTFRHAGRRTVGEIAFFGDSSVEIDQQGIGLDPFAITHFSGAKINGKWIVKQKPIRTNWVNTTGGVLVTASKLTAHDTFTTTFKRSS